MRISEGRSAKSTRRRAGGKLRQKDPADTFPPRAVPEIAPGGPYSHLLADIKYLHGEIFPFPTVGLGPMEGEHYLRAMRQRFGGEIGYVHAQVGV